MPGFVPPLMRLSCLTKRIGHWSLLNEKSLPYLLDLSLAINAGVR